MIVKAGSDVNRLTLRRHQVKSIVARDRLFFRGILNRPAEIDLTIERILLRWA